MSFTVSIIVPVYKSEAYIGRCLDSLCNQKYQNIEIIVVDDGSPDSSLKIVSEYQIKDNRIRILKQQNEGAASALNNGTIISTGEYITYLDSDDFIDCDTISDAVKIVNKYDVDLVFWSFQKFNDKGYVTTDKFNESDIYYGATNIAKLKNRIIGLADSELTNPTVTDFISAGWGKLYKSSLIRNRIFWKSTEIVGSSDVAFNNEVFININSAYYISRKYNFYYLGNPASLTKNYKLTLFSKYKRLFAHIQDVNNSFRENPKSRINYRNRIALSLINLTLSICGSSGNTFTEKYKMINTVLNDELFSNAIYSLNMKHLPLHFKVFYFFAKHKSTITIFGLGVLMKRVRESIND